MPYRCIKYDGQEAPFPNDCIINIPLMEVSYDDY